MTTLSSLQRTTKESPALRVRERPAPTKSTTQEAAAAKVRKEAEALVVEFYNSNKDANEAKRLADAAKKRLDKLMAQNDIARIDTKVGDVAVEALYVADEVNEVDVLALRKLTDERTFLEIVSASQKDVKDTLGENVLNKVLKTVVKEPALKVRAVK